MINNIILKIKLFFKRSICTHDYDYKGKKDNFHVHVCSKCNHVFLEKDVFG